ncbi:MAG: NrsF family protein [Inquilinus sp.]|uniref:NrsF family protein n=1 Tax=Inquilinus sp. TaxID=1932117 RepID=UPI003F3FE684
MKTETETDVLIRNMAKQAGATGSRADAFGPTLALAVGVSLAIAVGLILIFVGLRPSLLASPQLTPFAYKLAACLAMAGGALLLARRLALPGRGRPSLALLLPGVLVLAYRAVTDPSGYSILGNSEISVQACILTIVVASLPALALTLMVMRHGAPIRPAWAGAAAGLLAGSLGATAYTLACKNDGGPFVAAWYPAAIVIVSAIGAAVGRRMLVW